MQRRQFLTGCGCTGLLAALPACSSPAPSFADEHFRTCGFGPVLGTPVTNVGDPAPESVKVVGWLCDLVGIKQRFEVRSADIGSNVAAFATIRGGQRYIVYNRSAFSWQPGGARWEDILIMAHEVGHHIGSHVVTREVSQHTQELDADYFAGMALAHFGASLEQATSRYWDWPATPSHPAGLRRKAAIASGWRQARAGGALRSPECRSVFESELLDVSGRQCRIVNTCESGVRERRLACIADDGAWQFAE